MDAGDRFRSGVSAAWSTESLEQGVSLDGDLLCGVSEMGEGAQGIYGVGAVDGDALNRKKGSDSVEDSLLSSLRVRVGSVGP